MAAFSCQDLPANGLTLTPPSHPGFAALVEDIRHRMAEPNPAGPPLPPRPFPESLALAAVLVNHSAQPVAALALEWRYGWLDGRHNTSRVLSPFGRSLLLPFGAKPEQLALYGYWHTILPGSKRLLTELGMFGDNTGVRPPRSEESWKGGGMRMGSSGRQPADLARLRTCTLAIDGVFFADGEFAGPNALHLWDDIYYEAEVRTEVARLALHVTRGGGSPAEVVAKVLAHTGAPDERASRPLGLRGHEPTADEFRAWHRNQVAAWLTRMCPHLGDEAAIQPLLRWLDTARPNLRRG